MAVPLRNGPEWLPAEAMAVGPDSLWLFSALIRKFSTPAQMGRSCPRWRVNENQPTGYADLLLDSSGSVGCHSLGQRAAYRSAHKPYPLAEMDLRHPPDRLCSRARCRCGRSASRQDNCSGLTRAQTVTAEINTGQRRSSQRSSQARPRASSSGGPAPMRPTSRLKVGDIAYVTKDPPVPNRIRKEPNRRSGNLGLHQPGRQHEHPGRAVLRGRLGVVESEKRGLWKAGPPKATAKPTG